MGSKKILVVDDSLTDRQIVVSACEAQGYEVVTAADGEEAIQKLSEAKPDLILLDVILPGKNGFQICRQIKKSPESKDIKIVMVTSKSQESDRFWGMKQGADGYLTKPFTEQELQAIILQMI